MGLLENIFKKPTEKQIENKINQYFKTFTTYKPVFTSYSGSMYEMELVRTAIHTHAQFSAKLKPVVSGSAYRELNNVLQYRPNRFSDTYKFLYRLRTMLEMENTAFIVPILDEKLVIKGYYPILPSKCEVLEYEGIQYLRYTFANGLKALIEFYRVGILTKFQFKNDFFGEDNRALNSTIDLIHTQKQGLKEGIKSSATVRFLGRLGNTYKSEDIKKERDRFKADNLGADNNGGIVLADNRYAELKQIESKQFTIDSEQARMIQENVYDYFNTNENIIRNKYTEDEWNAYYEGAIEPFALQLSLVLTNMTYTQQEINRGNNITLTSNRLQYASNSTKLSVITQLFDRGFLTHNEGREILNLAAIKDGDKHYIRKEYAEVENLDAELKEELGQEEKPTEEGKEDDNK